MFALQVHVAPYRRADDNVLATLSDVGLIFTLLGTLSLKLIEKHDDVATLLAVVAVLITAASSPALPCCCDLRIACGARRALGEQRQRARRRASRGRRAASVPYLRHTVGLGQDQARAIKAQLTDLIPLASSLTLTT